MTSPNFASPSFRAGSSDLTVAISPLGLVELADEEFEVHGPRLNRYAQNWAYYLGHHWGYRRETGEPQLTFNFVRALSDFITNFTFSRGVDFRSPKETESIVPQLLDRVWCKDNAKEQVLWEMGQQGGVSGDCFVKVAYEEPFQDPSGYMNPGRVRILPLNSSYCFPEWHPHDKGRLIRFKLKYKFWGTSLEGTRQVFTYTELVTDTAIEEYVNDELIDSRPNPLGVIPIVPIANIPVSGSPWGLSDIESICSLNKEYNEKATDISDIINYHAAPVTVITGAKASQLEKGPKKVWGGLPKEAQVFNLELGTNLDAPLQYLDRLKTAMHEMTGVPVTALGQEQAVSNTSGVALAIQYQPLMNRYNLKKIQYTAGIKRINSLIMKTLALKEPQSFIWNPTIDSDGLKEGQVQQLNPADPITYENEVHWPSPLPTDVIVKLNEEMTKMQLGIQSKTGALRELGEAFPDEKLAEIMEELIQDAKDQAVLDLIRSDAQATIMNLTGVNPTDGTPNEPPPAPGPDGAPKVQAAGGPNMNSVGNPSVGTKPLDGVDIMHLDEMAKMRNEIVTKAFGTRYGTRKSPDNTDD